MTERVAPKFLTDWKTVGGRVVGEGTPRYNVRQFELAGHTMWLVEVISGSCYDVRDDIPHGRTLCSARSADDAIAAYLEVISGARAPLELAP